MKAIKYNSFGGQDKMQWVDILAPVPSDKQLLIKMKAVSINPVDWKIRNGEMKLFMDKKFPKGLGLDFSGIIESVGSNSSKFKKGDEVFGWLPYNMVGSIAEFFLADETLTTLKPENVSFENASTLPMACIASLTALVDNAKIKSGQSVLINGCTGGVGQCAGMIAKANGAIVTGTCSSSYIETAKKIGVDHVIDFTKSNVLDSKSKFDVIFDTAGNLNFGESKKIMNSKSIFLELNPTIVNLLFGSIKNIFSGKKVKSVIAKASTEKLEIMSKLLKQEKINPVIGKIYDFKDSLEVYNRMENGEKNLGKTIILNN